MLAVDTNPDHPPLKSNQWWIILVLYIIQGSGLKITQTIPLIYKVVPSYTILGYFEFARMAYLVKFLIAPVTERYTSLSYGRRKTWIVAGSLSMSIFCLLLSFYCDDSMMMVAIVLTFFIITSLVVQDISLDALTLKEINKAETASYVQTAGLTIGEMVGSLFFIKLISRDFAIRRFGMENRIMSPSTFIIIIAIVMFVLAVYFHFSYKQPQLEDETVSANQERTLAQTFKVYKIFLDSSRKQFRLSVLLVIMYQGILFYAYTYTIQLMKNGYSREQIKQLQNFSIIPSLIFCYFYSKIDMDPYDLLKYSVFVRFAVYAMGYILSPTNYYKLLIYIAVDQVVSNCCFLAQLTCINSIRLNKYSGMIICMFNSLRNVGDSQTPHLWIIGKIGFNNGCYVGAVVQVVILVFLGRVVEWVKEGDDGEFEIQ